MGQRISREEEGNLPNFKDHNEARKFFKDKYGSKFQLMDSQIIDDKKIYFYSYILNKESFWKGQEEMKEKGYSNGLEFMNSYQSVEIWEDGRIHIIH